MGDRRSIALSLNNLGLALQDSGEFKQALATFERSLAIRREISDLLGVVMSLIVNYLVTHAATAERVARARTVQVAVEAATGALQFATPAILLERVAAATSRAAAARGL